jgi:dolichyl-phosphate beta-glucosyltransferase
MEIKLSVIVPAFNESKNLRKGVLDALENYLKRVNYGYEVVIVDDGSTDDSAQIVKDQIKGKKNFRLIENSHNGKAVTVITGMLSAKGEIALFTDMDQATPIKEVEKIIKKMNQGFDIVIGSRLGRQGAPFIRRLSAWGFAVLRNLILGLPFKDTQCGFKAFNYKSRTAIFTKILPQWKNNSKKGGAVNAGFDVETLFIAKKLGFEISEVEVEWHYVDTERVQVVKDSIDAVYDMLRVRINDLTGKYG